jgi:hypothetical protein
VTVCPSYFIKMKKKTKKINFLFRFPISRKQKQTNKKPGPWPVRPSFPVCKEVKKKRRAFNDGTLTCVFLISRKGQSLSRIDYETISANLMFIFFFISLFLILSLERRPICF